MPNQGVKYIVLHILYAHAITCYIYKIWISHNFDYIWKKLSKTAPNLQGKLPPTHPLFKVPTDFGCFSGRRRRWFHRRGIRCIGLPLTVHGNERIDYSSKMILLSFCCCLLLWEYMQSNMNLYVKIFMDLNNIIQAGEVLPNSSSNTNRVE